ncbi:MAG: PKD domain-containing protein, partial [Actinobacteria bacterium]|nr:PKD domain-containing protein [Actinomycetota bacterium]
ANLNFRVTHNGQTQTKTQDIAVDPVVIFNTILVTGELLDSTGTGIPGALIQYRAGTWRDLGTTDANGQTQLELLPANLNFRVTHNAATLTKTQNIAVDPFVGYQTGKVLQGVGPRVLNYRTSAWFPFVDGVELLPLNVTFDLDTGPNEVHTPVAGAVIYVPTAPTSPTVDAGVDLLSDEGEVVAPVAPYLDLEAFLTHAATLDWGDGSPIEAGVVTAVDGLGGTVTGQHIYADDGVYMVTVCVTDNGNPDATGCDVVGVTVMNVAPTVSITGAADVETGQTLGLDSQVTDPGASDAHTYSWVVSHNGTEMATGDSATLDITPTDSGLYEVSLTVDDGDGGVTISETAFGAVAPPAPDPEPEPEPEAETEPAPEPEADPTSESDTESETDEAQAVTKPNIPSLVAGWTIGAADMASHPTPAMMASPVVYELPTDHPIPVVVFVPDPDGESWPIPVLISVAGLVALLLASRRMLST